jgi:hypothetical protein
MHHLGAALGGAWNCIRTARSQSTTQGSAAKTA